MESLVVGMRNSAFWEKLATRETGRPTVAVRETAAARLAVYPERLRFTEIVKNGLQPDKSARYYLSFPELTSNPAGLFQRLPRFIRRLARILKACSGVELYLFSPHMDWPAVLATAVFCRLIGRSVVLHDYCFRSVPESRAMRLIYSLCDQIIYGDISMVERISSVPPRISARIDAADNTHYRSLCKGRAVPKVIVYGDFNDNKVMTLVGRTHDLIKQKYPRTEFILASMTAVGSDFFPACPDSIKAWVLYSEDDLRKIYAESDMLMLLSPGGLDRLFGCRALLAGFPIITNGFDILGGTDSEPVAGSVITPRDSYSALADAAIRAVDDEAYYQSFVAS